MSGPTQLISQSDARRNALVVHSLRLGAFRIVADCERMLEALYDPDRRAWHDAVADALIAGRHLLLLTTQAARDFSAHDKTQPLASVADRIREPQQRILDAMKQLQQFVPVNTEEELLLQDARLVSATAAGLLPGGPNRMVEPVNAQPAAGPDAVTAERPHRASRILVVDDESMMRDLLKRRLRPVGYEVVEAENAQRALVLSEKEPFDLIITDINMPGLSGMEMLRLLKSGERTRDIPVIVVSGQDDLASVAQCIEDGAEDHLTKPYQPIILHARVRASLERKRMRDLELDYLHRVAQLTSAAEAVEGQLYVPGSLAPLASHDDALGRLARVFDRMVSGLKSREERLQHRLRELRREMTETGDVVRQGAAVTVESPFMPGHTVGARYQVVAHLGNGGMGMVYRARDLELNEDVAIKVIRDDLVREDPAVVDRLKSEIRLARKISHPNVVRTHDLGEWEGTYFITMEYVEGITVAELLDRRGRLTIASTLAIVTQLCEALAIAHEARIIHRDIKPANLLVDGAGVLKVMDFGIARSIAADSVRQTQPGFIIGTPQYMAPEQLMGGVADTRSDLFAVGVVLYECLTGRAPFDADSAISLMAQIIDGNYPKLSALVPDVPLQLEKIVHQQLSLQPGDRSGSARELADALSALEHAVAP